MLRTATTTYKNKPKENIINLGISKSNSIFHYITGVHLHSLSLHIKQMHFYLTEIILSFSLSTTAWHTGDRCQQHHFKHSTNTRELPLVTMCQVCKVTKFVSKLHKHFCYYALICTENHLSHHNVTMLWMPHTSHVTHNSKIINIQKFDWKIFYIYILLIHIIRRLTKKGSV
jgi:hypothetical protein